MKAQSWASPSDLATAKFRLFDPAHQSQSISGRARPHVSLGSIATEVGGSPPLTLSANALYVGQVVSWAAAKLPH
jgi:hypothetical protein